MIKYISLIIALTLLTSCVTSRFPSREVNFDPQSINAEQFKNIRIGVQHVVQTEIWDAANSKNYDYEKAATNEFLIENNERILKALRSTGLFKQVDYEYKFTAPPDIVITAIQGPPNKGDADAVMATGLSLGLIPTYETLEHGLYFKIVAREDLEFRCDWPIEIVYGWTSFFHRKSKGWGVSSPCDFINHLKVCITQQLPEILKNNEPNQNIEPTVKTPVE